MCFDKTDFPEQVGVNSKILCEFFDMLDRYEVDNHAFILIKDENS